MASKKEITATEKLLEMIRRDDSTEPQTEMATTIPPLELEPDSDQDYSEPVIALTLEDEESEESEPSGLSLEEPTAGISTVSPSPPPPPLTNEALPAFARIRPLPAPDPDNAPGPRLALVKELPLKDRLRGPEVNKHLFSVPTEEPVAETTVKTKVNLSTLLSLVKNHLPQLPGRAGVTVGVDIDPEYIALVKMNTAASPATLLAYRVVPLVLRGQGRVTSENLFSSPDLQNALRQALRDLCKGEKNYAVWTTISLDHVTVSNVTIPKVAAAEIPTAVFWTVQKEMKFDQQETIFDFSILEGIGNDPKKMTALVFIAKRRMIEKLKALFTTIGFPLSGITIAAIAIQNLIQTGWVEAHDGTAAHLYFGEQKSYIDLYSHGQLLFGREIHTGITSFVESVLERASDNFLILDDVAAKSCIFTSAPVSPKSQANHHGQTDEARMAIAMENLPATRRLIRQMERTFSHCNSNYGINNIKEIFTSGLAQLNQTVFNEINAELGMSCTVIDPFTTAKFIDQPAIHLAPPATNHSQLLAAFGLALANNHRTQNFLNTNSDKKSRAKIQALNKIIIGFFLILSLLGLVTYAGQRQVIRVQERALQKLTATFTEQSLQTKGSADPNYAIGLAGKIQGRYKTNLASAKRFYPMALLHELLRTIPDPIQLTKLGFTTVAKSGKERKGAEKEKPAENEEENVNQITMEGIITGQAEQLNFILVSFRQQLEALPLLASSILTEKKTVTKAGEEILQFTIQLEPKKLSPPGPPSTEKEK